NLQVPKTPRVLGVPADMIARGGFTFAKHLPTDVPPLVPRGPGVPGGEDNPWAMLEVPGDNDTIPAFADAATAQWQLKTKLGDVVTVPTASGLEVKLRIVGWLSGSVFAGELLVSEANFTRHFGTGVGYRFLLVACDEGTEPEVAAALRATLGDMGFSVERTTDVLAAYLEVQNTYLAAFETLGGLGLVLATFGIVTVLLRSVIERRAELAMMLSVGFRRRSVVALVLVENAVLLVTGIVIGTVSALVAAGPQLVSTVADVRWGSLMLTLVGTVAVGLVSCAVAANASVRDEVIQALRSE
ncbi:MAG TPA: FtsX-like permease family protein, partial [Planctomycetota bacterium]|nr:FtsX-like permease family protein [Planctomycetota bacterium]